MTGSQTPTVKPTLRAFLIGSVGAAIIGAIVPYCNMVLHGSRISAYHNTPIAVILFFILVMVVNSCLGLLRRNWMLDRAELALIYIMWVVSAAIPEWGFTAFLLTHTTGMQYYASSENNWDELLAPFVAEWLIPQDLSAVVDFYEGAPQGAGIPWNVWLRPLLFWVSFAVALYLAMICIMVILRKQWIERERLVFPMVQLPIAMIQDSDTRRSVLLPFFKSATMWVGFAVPLTIGSLKGLNHYIPSVPTIELYGGGLPLFGDVHLPISLSLQMLGFTYFVSREISFGMCLFFVLTTIERGIFNILGVYVQDPLLGPYSAYKGSVIVHQGFGAIIMLVLFGAWTARRHLKEVFRRAFRFADSVDDSDEILSYRSALLLLLGSLLFMGVWLTESGLPGWITPIYLFFAVLLFVGITRVVAEGGLAFIFAPMIASDFIAAGFGTRALGASGIMAFSFTYVWASDILTFVMASAANGLKLAEETIHRGRRLIFWGMLAAIAATLVTSIWTILDLGYRYGGINTDQFFFDLAAQTPFKDAAIRMKRLQGPHWINWGYTGIGAGIMGLLMAARHRFYWWPLHPLGFPTSAVFGMMFFSVFTAWLCKSLVMKYGGPKLYLKTRPFFMGLILGQFLTAGLWYAIDYLLGGSYNDVLMF